MIDHVSFSVNDFEESVRFYDGTLAELGYAQVLSFPGVALYGLKGSRKPDFSISARGKQEEPVGAARGVHFAFKAPSKDAVNRWHAKALELGAQDNGKPGYRKQYHPGYYGAFVIDPNGWRVEAVYHE